jgi:sec-independent protein translocase protein TatA
MTPMAFDLGGSEIIIVVLIALVLFGGSRIAGLGKGAGRAIREFKEETSSLTAAAAKEQQDAAAPAAEGQEQEQNSGQAPA